MLSRLKPSSTLSALALAFTGTLVVALIQGPKPFYADSAGYWSLGGSFMRDGHFSLLNFDSFSRGYAIALITGALRLVAHALRWSDSSVVKLFNVVIFTLIGAALAPRLAHATWRQPRWGAWRRVALVALLVVFWSGDLDYPLSDFPGLALALLALVAIAHPDRPGSMLIAGVAGALAIDVRPAYLLLAPLLLAIAMWAWLRERDSRSSLTRRALCVGLLVCGFALASLPESLASHRHFHTWSFLPGGSAAENLTFGMWLQRYDTFIGPRGQALPMDYFDAAGARLLAEQPGEIVSGPAQYVGIAVAHPLVIAGLIIRHLVNGFDMRYTTVYVEHLDAGGHLWLRLAGFLLVFLAFVRLLWPAARRSLGPARWRYFVAALLCCFTSVFTGIETRYMLPAWVLVYILVLAPGWPCPVAVHARGSQRFRTPVILLLALLVFTASTWYVVSGAVARVAM
jgi:hypothetical protein